MILGFTALGPVQFLEGTENPASRGEWKGGTVGRKEEKASKKNTLMLDVYCSTIHNPAKHRSNLNIH